jgi:sporulation protein YlmC with PRC-barrel domain
MPRTASAATSRPNLKEATIVDIPLNADVHCTDGLCGRSTHIIVNPVTRQMTHIVVEEREFPRTQHLVPLETVIESRPALIRLHCTREELAAIEPFIETEFVEADPSYIALTYGIAMEMEAEAEGGYMTWPYVLPDMATMPVEHERVPPGELAVRRGTRVAATDGRVGRVDEFLVDPANEYITHLILREGHLWGQKDVTIPVSEIKRIEEDMVYLKLSKKQVGALPTIPIRR